MEKSRQRLGITRLVLFLLATVVAQQTVFGQGSEIGLERLLQRLADLRSIAYLKPWTCRQFSSFDRTGGNADAGHFLARYDGEAVLCETDGPGAVVRIWSANPQGTLRIYIDGSQQPVLECPMRDFLEGRLPPIRPPLAMPSSGGAITYFPIPFAQKIKITVTNPGTMYYHVNVVHFPKDWKVHSFRWPLTEKEVTSINELIRQWNSPPLVPADVKWQSLTLPPRGRGLIFSLQGPGWVTGFFAGLASGPLLAWRKTILRIFWDDEKSPSVEAPLGDFFGSGFGPAYVRSVLLGFTGEGIGYCRFPMPFAKRGVAEIINGADEPVTFQIAYQFERLSPEDVAAMGYFHAQWFWWFTRKGQPHLLMKADKGPGHFVGASMTMQSAAGLGFLEGDELFYSDGDKVFNGTGTEDYFNSGWYFLTGPVVGRLHGCVRRTDNSVTAYRFHLTDAVPWKRRFLCQIEHGGINDTEGVEYSSVAYWYQKEPHTDFFKIPDPSFLKFPHSPFRLPPGSLVATEALLDGKDVDKVPLFRFTESAGMTALVLRPPVKTARLLLKTPADDLVRLKGFFVKRQDFGRFKVYLDKEFLGWIDCRSDQRMGQVFFVDLGLRRIRPESRIGIVSEGIAPVAVLGFSMESQSPFITRWLVCGPYPNEQDKGLDQPFPPEKVRDIQEALTVAEWKRVDAADGVLDFLPLFRPNTDVVAYAMAEIRCPQARKGALLIGSDDGVKVWLNGEVVHHHHIHRPLARDADIVPVRFREGSNWLLVKVENGGGEFALSVRVLDPDRDLTFTTYENLILEKKGKDSQ
ncbi:MAG: DUF2961 domain-containing protein [Armatimonadetes bacterium]|nr:DUF2961 domain-containing protein [Armatimonadota bacterium]MDW8120999.1 glycoside hydrolase family 172 protein [Armatimonadota bacterium]